MWHAQTEQAWPYVRERLPVLDDAEKARAAHLLNEPKRRDYLTAHVMLREVLASCIGTEPNRLDIRAGPNGKPELDGLHFNLSHTEGFSLLAVSFEQPIGADVEALRERRITPRLYERVCGGNTETPDWDTFYRHWVRREASTKLTGRGVTGLFTDPLAPFLHGYTPTSGYVAAIALDRQPERIELLGWGR